MPNSAGAGGRATLTPKEVKAVLAQFALPAATSVHEFRKGSSRFPKAIVETASGKCLLKRRGGSPEDEARIAYAHDVQLALSAHHFPVPALVRTHEGASWVAWEGAIYELFEFIEGDRFHRSAGEARESGLFLSRLHRTLKGWKPYAAPPHPGGYHKSRTVAASWGRVASGILAADPHAAQAKVAACVADLERQYAAAMDHSTHVLEAPGSESRISVIHGDFHPGNLLFVAGSPIVMIDFDAVRPDQTVVDIANGSLQFGMHPVGDKPVSQWVPTLNLVTIEAFLRGYALSGPMRLSRAECTIIPTLMIEAAIAECVPRVALSGLFAKRPGAEVLAFVREKTHWIWEERERIATLCWSCMSGR